MNNEIQNVKQQIRKLITEISIIKNNNDILLQKGDNTILSELKRWKEAFENLGIRPESMNIALQKFNLALGISDLVSKVEAFVQLPYLTTNDWIFTGTEVKALALNYKEYNTDSLLTGITRCVWVITLLPDATIISGGNNVYQINETEDNVLIVKQKEGHKFEIKCRKEKYVIGEIAKQLRPDKIILELTLKGNVLNIRQCTSTIDINELETLIEFLDLESVGTLGDFMELMDDVPVFSTIYINVDDIFGEVVKDYYNDIMQHWEYVSIKHGLQTGYDRVLSTISTRNLVSASTIGGFAAMNQLASGLSSTVQSKKVRYIIPDVAVDRIVPTAGDISKPPNCEFTCPGLVVVQQSADLYCPSKEASKINVGTHPRITQVENIGFDFTVDGEITASHEDDAVVTQFTATDLRIPIKKVDVATGVETTATMIIEAKVDVEYKSKKWVPPERAFVTINTNTLLAVGFVKRKSGSPVTSAYIVSKNKPKMRFIIPAPEVLVGGKDQLVMNIKINEQVTAVEFISTVVNEGDYTSFGYQSGWYDLPSYEAFTAMKPMTVTKSKPIKTNIDGLDFAYKAVPIVAPPYPELPLICRTAYNDSYQSLRPPYFMFNSKGKFDVNKIFLYEFIDDDSLFNGFITNHKYALKSNEQLEMLYLSSAAVCGNYDVTRKSSFVTGMPILKVFKDEKTFGVQHVMDKWRRTAAFDLQQYKIPNTKYKAANFMAFGEPAIFMQVTVLMPCKVVIENKATMLPKLTGTTSNEISQLILPDGLTGLTHLSDRLLLGEAQIAILFSAVADIKIMIDNLGNRVDALETAFNSLIDALTPKTPGAMDWFSSILSFAGSLVGPFLPLVGTSLMIGGQLCAATANFQEGDVMAGVRDIVAAGISSTYVGYKYSKRMNDRRTQEKAEKSKVPPKLKEQKYLKEELTNCGGSRAVDQSNMIVFEESSFPNMYGEYPKSLSKIKSANLQTVDAKNYLVECTINNGIVRMGRDNWVTFEDDENEQKCYTLKYYREYNLDGQPTKSYGHGIKLFKEGEFLQQRVKPLHVLKQSTTEQFVELHASYLRVMSNFRTFFDLDDELLEHLGALSMQVDTLPTFGRNNLGLYKMNGRKELDTITSVFDMGTYLRMVFGSDDALLTFSKFIDKYKQP